jgi:dTDP-4-amino-4,6-dideoxygalactose transaminase
MTCPAVLGGSSAFPGGLAFARPMVPPLDVVMARLQPSYDAGVLTNGPLVRALEECAAERLGTDHVVAVGSCTAGLMLALRVLDVRRPVVLPGFTFSASAHAVAWNALELRFAECDPETFQLDVDDAVGRLDGAGALLATHIFGAPCRAAELQNCARRSGIPIVFDAAHAFGASHQGRPVGGFGDAEVFSLSPTKIVVAGEGGIVTTPHVEVANALRAGRDYGNPGDYDTRFVGLNARMSELHAALALESFALVDEHLARRRALAAQYSAGLAGVPGVAPQIVADGDLSTYKDFTIQIDQPRFGLSRDELVKALQSDGIDTRCYFDPPVHRQTSYAYLEPVMLPVTDAVSSRVISLPMWGGLPFDAVDRVVAVIAEVHARAEEVRAALD